MTEYTKKIVSLAFTLVLILVLAIVVCFVDIDLKLVKFHSIKSILSKHGEVVEAETKLKQKESEYNTAVQKINESKTAFDTAKAKYEAISDETINVIKEATTEENYNIEYMWIRLGNYATKNNLKIVMAEPGGTFVEEKETTEKDGTTKTKTTTTTTTDTNTNKNTTVPTTTEQNTNKTTENTDKTNNATQDTLFKIQVTGSYLNVSDFVFEVENDKALRFKLDNISMDYVSGTTIKATFNVKNLIINK